MTASTVELENPSDSEEPLPPAACAECGVFLTETGTVDTGRIEESARHIDWTVAMRDDHDQAVAYVDRLESQVALAKKLKDEPGRLLVERALGAARGRVQDTAIALIGRGGTPPANGTCGTCSTVFRAGHVDITEAERAGRERERLSVQLATLEHELRSALQGVALNRAALVQAKAQGSARLIGEAEESLNVALGYRQDVQAGIASVRNQLSPPATRKEAKRS